MIKKVILISIISMIAILGLLSLKIVNIQHMEATDNNAESYSDISGYGYIIFGLMVFLVAIWTYKIHIVAGAIPIFLGLSAIGYGIYILNAKGIISIF